MADEEVKITISADDQASSKLKGVGEAAKKAGETGRLGMYALGEAAETAAEKMGVPSQVSRQLGNSVERMAASLGTAGIALGVVGLAATSAVLIWRKYREEQEKIRLEKIKMGQMAGTWIEGILKETSATTDLVAAKKSLARAEFDLNKARIEEAIPAAKKAAQAAIEAYAHAEIILNKTGYGLIPNRVFGDEKTRQEAFNKAKADMAKYIAEYNMLVAQSKLYNPANRDKVADIKAGKSLEETDAERNARVLAEIEYRKNLAILALRDQLAADNVKRYEEEQRLNEMRLQASQETVGNLAQTFQLMSQLHTSHARRYFSIYKVAAIGETIISTSRAAMKAYAEYGPTFGSVAAAAIVALGAAKVAIIRAQSFDGGGGAVGTFSANPATGLPAGSGGPGGGSGGTIIINVNGQKVGEYDLAAKVARTIYNNNGSVDGYSIAVERSA